MSIKYLNPLSKIIVYVIDFVENSGRDFWNIKCAPEMLSLSHIKLITWNIVKNIFFIFRHIEFVIIVNGPDK